MEKIASVVFDVGGVLVQDAPNMLKTAQILGLDESEALKVEKAIWDNRDAYDLGLADNLYWEAICQDLNIAPPSTQTLEKLVQIDVDRWSHPAPEMLELIADLYAKGYHLAILSNAPTVLAKALRANKEINTYIKAMCFSCEQGYAKPDIRIYQDVCQQIQEDRATVLMVDDREVNIAGAKKAGMQGWCWKQNLGQLRDLLEC